MMKYSITPRVATILALIVCATSSRFLDLPPNFTAVGAIALFAGACFASTGIALLVVFATMLFSDAVIGFHSTIPYVYACYALTVLLGHNFLRQDTRPLRLVGGGAAHCALFFIITNLGVWASQALYPKTLAGLITCYVAGLPFLGNTIGSTALFMTLLFGSLALLEKGFPALSRSGLYTRATARG